MGEGERGRTGENGGERERTGEGKDEATFMSMYIYMEEFETTQKNSYSLSKK